MARQIGAELIDRMRHMNDSLESIQGGESDSPQPVERTPSEPSTPAEGTRQAECPYVTGTVTRYCTLTPLTLTDAEREAIEDAVQAGEFDAGLFDCEWARKHAATLRGLLERTAQTIK